MSDRYAAHGQTDRQRALATYIDRFRNSSSGAADFMEFLRRSDAGIWRVEADSGRNRWWLNITLPKHHQDIFDLNREIQVFYTEYENLEPRALSVIQTKVRKDMRLEPDVAVLVSRDPRAKMTAARRAGEMAIIPINLDEVREGSSPLLHAYIAQSVAAVDHFDVVTPIREPSGFFGRKAELETIANDLKLAKSVGLFGLRKAGKTSLLNSIERLREDDARNATVSIDISGIATAEQFRSMVLERLWTAVRKTRGNEDAHPRVRALTRQGGRRQDTPDSSTHWIQDLRAMLDLVELPAVLIIDEIDQAFPPRSNLDPAEAKGLFSALIQLRSVLQEQDRLALLCAGVDPALFERPIIEGKDNLLYKLVRLVWLGPMSRDEMAEMVRALGKRMGVRVRNHEVIDALFKEYGGHPLLTRKACSLAVRARSPETLPFHIDNDALAAALASVDYGGPSTQAADIIESFTEWFADEAALLRMYFSSDPEERDFGKSLLQDNPRALLHSVAYGLCFTDHTARIGVAIAQLKL